MRPEKPFTICGRINPKLVKVEEFFETNKDFKPGVLKILMFIRVKKV